MPKQFLSIIFVLSFCAASAQTKNIDSLSFLVNYSKEDSNKVNYLWQLGDELSISNPEKALKLASEGLLLAQQIKYTEGQSRSYGILAKILMNMGNYPSALEYNFKKLKIEEQRIKPQNMASVLMNIGIVYVLQDQYKDALKYYSKADSVINKYNIKSLSYNIALNIGDVYDRMKKNDSAFKYFNQSLVIAQNMDNDEYIGASLTGMGHSYSKLGSYKLAKASYESALEKQELANDADIMCETLLGLAGLYRIQGLKDSVIKYAHLSYQVAVKSDFIPRQLNAVQFLSEFYHEEKKSDSAYAYILKENRLNDSIFSKTNIRQSQVLSSNETLRQLELEESRKLAKQERKQQLQMLFIAIFIPMFFIFTLLLSRIRLSVKVMRVLGVLSLLFLFEYLTLLLHPFVAELTHHTPILEILIFVAVAALLIPMHHRLEHALLHWLVKNRKASTSDEINLKVSQLRQKL